MEYLNICHSSLLSLSLPPYLSFLSFLLLPVLTTPTHFPVSLSEILLFYFSSSLALSSHFPTVSFWLLMTLYALCPPLSVFLSSCLHPYPLSYPFPHSFLLSLSPSLWFFSLQLSLSFSLSLLLPCLVISSSFSISYSFCPLHSKSRSPSIT